ncbi:unnamed protein product [Rhizophagus irregularis]|uniref:Uncharacterized protein n=1 Tax=Rhizophagus irregularis TaxID=588596 RepID=A0A915YX71_9GLOM|nr:unnamed protein product [Rhizophagus irregularis]
MIRVRHSVGLPKYRNPKIRSALRWASEDWKSKEFVSSVFGLLLKIGNPKNSFGTGVQCRERLLSSEERKKLRFVSGVLGEILKNRIPKDSFGLRFLGVEYMDFGSWILDIWISAFGYWALDSFHFKLILNRSGFHFEFLVRFFFVLLLRNRRVFPSDFIRSGFLRTFIRLGEDDE